MTWIEIENLISDNEHWLWPVAALIASLIIKLSLKIFSISLRKITHANSILWSHIFLDILDRLKTPVLFVWTFYLFSKYYTTSETTSKIWLTAVVVTTTFQIALWGLFLIGLWRKNFTNERLKQDPTSSATLGIMFVSLQSIFIVIIVLIGLSHLGIDIRALVAGLGVGGIAVALAAQNVLGDLLASLSIVLDKPFTVGDYIVVGSESGTVESIGIKTTRLRTLSGEELIFSNKDLLESRVHNYKSLCQRRVVKKFGVLYSTTTEQLTQIPKWTKEIVEQDSKIRFDRCHFNNYGDSSLDFELVFTVFDPDYIVYMDCQQKILIELFKKFTSENIGFAFPSRSIYIENTSQLKAFEMRN